MAEKATLDRRCQNITQDKTIKLTLVLLGENKGSLARQSIQLINIFLGNGNPGNIAVEEKSGTEGIFFWKENPCNNFRFGNCDSEY